MNPGRVGLFLDLDGVLTPKAVNLQFAAMLAVTSELVKLEDDYANGSIDNAEFNRTFIPLFRGANFTEQFARERFRDIQLNPSAEELIAVSLPDLFIVSSSPSYYLDQFARRFNIPQANVISSRYAFSENGELLECTAPCGVLEKARFVESRVKRYTVSIGVGDSPEQDAKFMSLCTIKVLMGGERRNYLHASDLTAVQNLVETTRSLAAPQDPDRIPPECRAGVATLLDLSAFDRNVFIMTPFRSDARYGASIETIKAELKARGLNGWTAADKDLSNDLWANVRCFMHACKYGVALITAHEEKTKTGIRYKPDVFNPNVMAEVGYMMAQGKIVLLLKDNRVVGLPADWLGQLYTGIDFLNPTRQIRAAMMRWAEDKRD